MTATKTLTVDIQLEEHPETRYTRAEAHLHSDTMPDVRGVGVSSRNPRDPEIPEIGDELAVARALVDLAENLRRTAAVSIEGASTQGSHGW